MYYLYTIPIEFKGITREIPYVLTSILRASSYLVIKNNPFSDFSFYWWQRIHMIWDHKSVLDSPQNAPLMAMQYSLQSTLNVRSPGPLFASYNAITESRK